MKKIISVTAAVFFLLVFSTAITLKIGINSDVLYPYSISKDILSGISIKHWYFPGPLFLFPDITLSLPLVALLHTPAYWAVAFGFFQTLSLVVFISFFTEKKDTLAFSMRFISCAYLTFIIFLIGKMIFHTIWIETAGKAFIAVNHFSAGLCALILTLLIRPTTLRPTLKKISILSVFAFIVSFSDPFFCFYGFCLITPYFFSQRIKPSWLLSLTIIGISAVLGTLTNIHINPGFLSEFSDHKDSSTFHFLNNLIVFWKMAGVLGVLYVFIIPLALISFTAYQKKSALMPLLIAMFLIGTLCVLFGLTTKAVFYFRYICIYFAILAYVIFELIPSTVCRKLCHPNFVFLMTSISVAYGYFYFQNIPVNIFRSEFHTLLSCSKLPEAVNNRLIIATYWPAKPLFEKTDRQGQLLQVTPDLTHYNWIANPAWKTLHTKTPSHLVICTYQINPEKINAILQLPHVKPLCNGQLIDVPFNQKIITLVPALTSEK